MSRTSHPKFVVVFLLMIAIPQGVQFSRQFMKGFCPLYRDPSPTFFSWDMFANRVERCNLRWNTPLNFQNHSGATSLIELGPRLEWGITYNSIRDYEWIRMWLCRLSRKTARIQLNCFVPEGKEITHELDCSKM